MSIELLPRTQTPLGEAVRAERAARAQRRRCQLGMGLFLLLLGMHIGTRVLPAWSSSAAPSAMQTRGSEGAVLCDPRAAGDLDGRFLLLRPVDGDRGGVGFHAAQYGSDLAVLCGRLEGVVADLAIESAPGP